MRLRIVTLNVWNQQGDPKRIDLINRELRRLAPDLISFQEVVQSPQRRQLDELIDGTGLFDLSNDLVNLSRAASENIVMVKANDWIGL